MPGGHLEFGESFENCATREILEETGLTVQNVRFLTATNDVMEDEGKHYVTIFMGAVVDGDVQPKVGFPLCIKAIGCCLREQVLEPEKCVGWDWVAWKDIQSHSQKKDHGPRLFSPLLDLLHQRPSFEPSHSFVSNADR